MRQLTKPGATVQLEKAAERDGARVARGSSAATRADSGSRPENSRALATRAAGAGAGSPLPAALRGAMEHGFGASFEGVRVHADAGSAARARSAGARALTHGQDIYFGAREYQPERPRGRELIAHELTHTLQQRGGAPFVQCSPEEKVTQMVILRDTKEVLVKTDRNPDGYKYQLSLEEGLVQGTFRWKHTKGTTVDAGGDALITRPAKATGKVDWRIVPTQEGQPSWSELADSEFDMIVLNSSSLGAGTGKGKGSGDKSGSGSGTGNASKPKPTEAEKQAQAQKFSDKLSGTGGSGPAISAEKLKQLVGDWTDEQIEAFFKLQAQAKTQNPDKTFEQLLEWFGKLTPSDREALRINELLTQSTGGEIKELPQTVQLNISKDAQASAGASQKLASTEASIAAIRAKVHEVDPDRAENFEPLDPQKLTAFNEMLMLEALLSGATERAPAQIGPIAKELTSNIGKIRSFIIEELAWLAAEIAATTLLSILAAPFSGGSSAAAGAAIAATLMLRINQLRKILQTINKIRAAVETVTKLKNLFERVRKLADYKDKFDAYRGHIDRFLELKVRLEQADADVTVHEEHDKLEAELLALMQQLIAQEEFGEILDMLYLPDDATEDDLRQVLIDLPRGIELAQDLLSHYNAMKSGELEDTKVLMYKAFGVGYLLYPLVGFIAGKANEQLNALMSPKSLGDRLFGTLTPGRTKFGAGRAKNRERFGKVKKRERPKPAKVKDADVKAKDADAKAKPKDSDPKKPKDPDKEEKDKQKAADDAAWSSLKTRIEALGAEFPDGVTSEELVRRGREIKSEAGFKRVAGGAKVDSDRSKPSHWRLTVKRSDQHGKAEVNALKSPITRYKDVRKAIIAHFRVVKEANRTKTWVEQELETLKSSYQYTQIKLEEQQDANKAALSWTISGAMPGKPNFTEFTTVEAAGNYWGSKNNPIAVEWPKPAIDDYDPVFIGPYARKMTGHISQDHLEPLVSADRATKQKFADDLKAKEPAAASDVDTWIADGAAVTEYEPTVPAALPYGRKATIGVTTSYQVRPGYTFQLTPQGKTPGGGKIITALENYGYSMTHEGNAGDHVLEYSLGGPDALSNLWPLDTHTNSSSGALLKSMNFVKPGTTEVTNMKALKGKAGRPGKQNEIWFRVASVKK